MRLSEIVLWARDLDRACSFYEGIFGLERMATPPAVRNRFLRVRGSTPPEMIVLVPHPDPLGQFPTDKAARTLHHLALGVTGEEYERLEAACRAAGLAVRAGVHPVLEGVRTFYVDDPDGNEVEVIGA